MADHDPEMIYITLDSRRRAYLGKIVKNPAQYYLAHTEDDGTIVLTPAVVLPKAYAENVLKRARLSDKVEPERR